MRGDDGFTLVEVLAALAVFSLAAIGLIQVTGQSVRTADALEARFAARVVASNVLTEALVDPEPLRDGSVAGAETELSRNFAWTRAVVTAPIGEADTVLVTVRVSDARSGQELAEARAMRQRTQ